MGRMILVLLCLIFIWSAVYASDYVYIIPYRYRLPNIMHSYDYNYRTGGYSPYYDNSLYQRSLLYPPIYHILDDHDDDDDYGYMIDPYGGMWFFYRND